MFFHELELKFLRTGHRSQLKCQDNWLSFEQIQTWASQTLLAHRQQTTLLTEPLNDTNEM